MMSKLVRKQSSDCFKKLDSQLSKQFYLRRKSIGIPKLFSLSLSFLSFLLPLILYSLQLLSFALLLVLSEFQFKFLYF